MFLKFKKLLEKQNNRLYYIIAGEASGDLHGANIMSKLLQLDENIIFRGVGGPLMGKQGLKSLVDFNRLSVMGFLEIVRDLCFLLKIKKVIIANIKKIKPDKIILIDYPGFNLSLAKSIKKNLNIPIIFYISPQVWAWNEGRVNIIKKFIDQLIVVFPFEKNWYKKRKIDVNYFGHPLIDLYNENKNNQAAHSSPAIGLFPGSRKQEINYHLPLFEKIIKLIQKIKPEVRFVMGLAPGTPLRKTVAFSQKYGVQIIKNNSWGAFNRSSVAIVASGTATLECAISNTPFVVIYKTSLASWLIARLLLSVKYISIINILAQKLVVEEFIQFGARPEKIVSSVLSLLKNSEEVKQTLSTIVASLGSGQVYKNTAKHIINC